MVGGAQQLQCKSESAQCSEKSNRTLVRGMGLKFEKKNARKTIKSTPKKKLGIGSPVFCTFSFTQPNNIGPARQQPRDWGSLFNFSESGRGRGHSQRFIYNFGLWVLGIADSHINESNCKLMSPEHLFS